MTTASRPVLPSHTRFRVDRRSSDTLLLLPERGFVLNDTAVAILRLCTGEHTVITIIDRLVDANVEMPSNIVATDVTTFLQALTERGVLRDTIQS